jgi:uncharacterized membrane protein/nitrite reductase/ring-hydroxylating ferredoxin subunit
MRSRASFKSHPIHPILVGFPIAFFVGCVVFQLLGIALGKQAFIATSHYLATAGIVAAIAAAVPGLVDYLYTVPPKSSAKSRAAKHGLTNASVLLLFGVSIWIDHSATLSPWTVLAVRAIALVFLIIAGWMGGTLVYRNQIGVDIRYADAGKWNESYLNGSGGRVEVGQVSELQLNQMMLVHVTGKRIVVAKTETGFTAFDDRCTHKGGSLAGGSLICGTVQCPWHGSQFDVNTGAVKSGPAAAGIRCYKIEELGTKLVLIL